MTRKMFAAAGLVVCASWLPASAEGRYAGASYLSTSAEFEATLQDFEGDADGWKVFGGIEVNPNFGVELTYYDLGAFRDSKGGSTFDADVWASDLSLRGILPAGERFQFFGKLGFSYLDVESTTSGSITATVDANDWELIYGVGAALKIGERFGIRAEYEGWDTEGSLEAWSLGAYFRF